MLSTAGAPHTIKGIADNEKKNCDPAAIASVSCTNADQYCHCVRQEGILSNISACANVECENPSRDIYGSWSLLFVFSGILKLICIMTVFTTLFEEVCQKFNISVPVLGSNSSSNGSIVTVPISAGPSTTPFVGASNNAFAGAHILWLSSLVACVVAAGVSL